MLINIDEALRVSPVWCAMDTIVRSIAPCPWNVYELDGVDREIRPDDSLVYLLNTRANPWVTATAHREALLWSALGYGNGYSEIQFDGSNRVAAMWNLDPMRVSPRVDTKTGDLGYEVSQPSGGTVWVESWRIYHLRSTSLVGYVGENVIARAARSIATAAAAQQFAAAYFANGTVLSGFFTSETRMQPEDKETLKKEWAEQHSGGPGVKHKSPVFPPGLKWNALSSEPEKAQLIQTRQFSVPDIARWFGVPLHLLMDPQGSQGYGTNLEENGNQFVNGCLWPWAKRHMDEADHKLLPSKPAGRTTEIDLSRHTKGKFSDRAAGNAALKKAGVLSQNDVRRDMGLNTVAGGDVYFVESAMVPVQRAVNPPKPDPFIPAKPPPDPSAVARVAVAFDRFERRLSARRADLERHAPEKVESNLAEERKKLMPGLIADVRAALPIDPEIDMRVEKVAGDVLTGEPAYLAAKRLAETT